MPITVTLKEIRPSRREHLLAEACVELAIHSDGTVATVTIDDWKVARNKTSGELVVYAPSYSVAEGRNYKYFPVVSASTQLRREIDDVILEGYQKGTGEKAGFFESRKTGPYQGG